MKLATLLAEVSTQPTPPRCPVGAILVKLDKADVATLKDALADVSVDGVVIAKALRKQGFAIKDESLRRHRRGGCSCG